MNPPAGIPDGANAADPAATCPLCQGPNACRCTDLASGAGGCWCEEVEMPEPLLRRIPPAQQGVACVCRRCVAQYRQQTRWMPRARPEEFYTDPDGRLVFKASYHRRRGYCCGSGCRHCPFEPPGEKGNPPT